MSLDVKSLAPSSRLPVVNRFHIGLFDRKIDGFSVAAAANNNDNDDSHIS